MRLTRFGSVQQHSARGFDPTALDGSWLRFGDEVVLVSPERVGDDIEAAAARAGVDGTAVAEGVASNKLALVTQKGRLFEKAHPDVEVLMDYGRYLIVRKPDKGRLSSDPPCFIIETLPKDHVVFEDRGVGQDRRRAADPAVQKLVNAVTRPEFEAPLHHLVSFRTRHSTSQEFADAVTWCRTELGSFGYTTSTQTVTVGGSTTQNLIADKRGTGTSRSVILVIATSTRSTPPGAPVPKLPELTTTPADPPAC